MRLAAWYFLPAGVIVALLVTAVLVLGGFRMRKAVRVFGDEQRIEALRTFNPVRRRAYKGAVIVLAVLCAFFAAAQPQYGKGTRLIPATNIDVVIALDFSKSMYAKDVPPSRTFRAKLEIARLIKQLRGARFAAVAYAGEPMGFPLTADGAAIAQFLRQLSPNDMPVGGTATARALRYAEDMLNRDPKSREHKRVIILVTDGEDLEGDPVAAAKAIGNGGTTIHVVQIGGRTSERIPEIDAQGRVVGWRTDASGKPLMTQLSPEGEAQLEAIAKATPGGTLIRAAKGTTGIAQIAANLREQMKSELSERVESVYADIFHYPLALALLLLLMEVFIPEAPKRDFVRPVPPPRRRPLGLKKGDAARRMGGARSA